MILLAIASVVAIILIKKKKKTGRSKHKAYQLGNNLSKWINAIGIILPLKLLHKPIRFCKNMIIFIIPYLLQTL